MAGLNGPSRNPRNNWPMNTLFSDELVEVEKSLILQGWGYMAIANELSKRFPHERTPSPKTVLQHIAKVAPRPHQRVKGNYKPRAKMRLTPYVPEAVPEEPVVNTGSIAGIDEAFEAIVRDAFRAANNMPAIQKALDELVAAKTLLDEQINQLLRLLGK